LTGADCMLCHLHPMAMTALDRGAAAPAAPPTRVSVDSLTLDDVLCPICLHILIRPLSLHCGHSFCALCVRPVLARRQPRCPLCRSDAGVDQNVSVNRLLAKLIGNLYPREISVRTSELVSERERAHAADLLHVGSSLAIVSWTSNARRWARASVFWMRYSWQCLNGHVSIVAHLCLLGLCMVGLVSLVSEVQHQHHIGYGYQHMAKSSEHDGHSVQPQMMLASATAMKALAISAGKGVASAFQSSGRVKAAASGALAFHGQQGEVHSTATPPSKTAPERMQPLEPVAMSGGGADEIRSDNSALGGTSGTSSTSGTSGTSGISDASSSSLVSSSKSGAFSHSTGLHVPALNETGRALPLTNETAIVTTDQLRKSSSQWARPTKASAAPAASHDVQTQEAANLELLITRLHLELDRLRVRKDLVVHKAAVLHEREGSNSSKHAETVKETSHALRRKRN